MLGGCGIAAAATCSIIHPAGPTDMQADLARTAAEDALLEDSFDLQGRYRLIGSRRIDERQWDALIRRDATSGRSFALHRIDCAALHTRALGIGDAVEDVALEQVGVEGRPIVRGSALHHAAELLCRR